jgi:hypothetical protein
MQNFGIIILALASLCVFRANAGVALNCTYTGEVTIPPDGQYHSYGPYLASEYSLYITAIELCSKSVGSRALMTVVRGSDYNSELTYYSGPISGDMQPQMYQFAPNYCELIPTETLWIYAANFGQNPISAFLVFWYSRTQP